LVRFKWNRIYFLQAYDQLFDDDQKQLFSIKGSRDLFWWRNNQHYWTIAYTRDGQAPFFVKINDWKWQLGWSRLWTTDPNATLKLAQPGAAESTWCSTVAGHCLTFSDKQSLAVC